MHTTKLSEIMTTALVTIKQDDSFELVDSLFKNNDFHHLPVVDDDGKLVGILSKSDYLALCDSFSFFSSGASEKRNERLFNAVLAHDVMQKKIATLKPDSTAMMAAGFFKENLFHAIPIIDDQNKLVGLVTTFDLLNLAFSEPVS